MPPEQIAKYMDKEYKDVVENTAYHTLTYLREKLNLDNEFIKGWKDALIGGYEVYYCGVLNSEPYLERVNPMYFSFDKTEHGAAERCVCQSPRYMIDTTINLILKIYLDLKKWWQQFLEETWERRMK